MIKTIKLSVNGRENIQSRDEVSLLFDQDYTAIDKLVFDFENINFISRSPAHEFLKQADSARNDHGVDVEFDAMNEDVTKMFEIIKKSVITKIQKIKKIPYDSSQEFYDKISLW